MALLRHLRHIPRHLRRIQRFYDHPTPAYGHSAPFAAHPAPFTTFPHLLWPLRAFYCLSVPVSVLFVPLTAITCLFTAACLRAIPHLFIAYPRFYGLLRPVPRHLRPTHAICGPSASFAAHSRLLWSSRARLRPVHTLYGPSRACLQPIRAFLRLFCACLQPIRAFYGFPAPVCGHSAPFTALPRPQRAASYPSRHRLHPPDIPRGERRALPAPAQGSRPLRIPFGEPAPVFPVSPSPKRRRRTAPARGPSAVYALCR